MSRHELSNLLLLNEMVLVLDALSSSTSTKSKEKHRLTLRNTRIAQLQNLLAGEGAGGKGGRAIRFQPTGSEARSTGKE